MKGMWGDFSHGLPCLNNSQQFGVIEWVWLLLPVTLTICGFRQVQDKHEVIGKHLFSLCPLTACNFHSTSDSMFDELGLHNPFHFRNNAINSKGTESNRE